MRVAILSAIRREARSRPVAVAVVVIGILVGDLLSVSLAAEPQSNPVFSLTSNPGSLAAADPSGAPIHGIEVSPRGMARRDRGGALLVHRGRFVIDRAGEVWARALASPPGFTIEIVATPGHPDKSGTLVSLESAGAAPLLRIMQSGDELVAAFAAGKTGAAIEVPLGKIAEGEEFRAAIGYDGRQLVGYRDGTVTAAQDVSLASAESSNAQFVLGSTLDGAEEWEGKISGVSLYAAPLDATVVGEHARAAREKNSTPSAVETLVVDAELIGKSPVPTLAQLAPYTQSLAVYEYKVEKVRAGKYESEKLYVAHWGVLDNTRLPFADVAAGGHYTLLLESFSDQPQLQSENLSDSIMEDFSLPLYYDAGGTSLGIDAAIEGADGAPPLPDRTTADVQPPSPMRKLSASPEDVRAARAQDLVRMQEQLSAQVTRAGGYPAWAAAVAPFREAVRQNAGSHDRYTIVGIDGQLFSRSGTDYLLDTDLIDMPMLSAPDRLNPARAIDTIIEFSRHLQAQGIDLIYVPVPAREEVYPDRLSSSAPPGNLVTPQLTQFLQTLIDQGVEVVDLREAFLDERTKHEELLYLNTEVHWGSYGIRRAAAEIAPRLRRYGRDTSSPPVEYSEKTIRTTSKGNLVDSLPESAKGDYSPFEQDVVEVINPDGTNYVDAEDSPVLVMGDSFTMWFLKYGGSLSAHLAKELQYPVSNLSSKGGGPKVPRVLAEKGPAYLGPRRVVIWAMVSRYLSDNNARLWEHPPALK